MSQSEHRTDLAVIGAGPGGYPAAFHAADLGLRVVLIDREANPGGVCLYRGCIPSKAILHAAGVLQQARDAAALGIHFGPARLDLDRLREWKTGVVRKLTTGLGGLTRKRGIEYVQGSARFSGSHEVTVETADGPIAVHFEHAIVATGSAPVHPGLVPDSPLVLDSTNALDLEDIPGRMLVMGGGYIGLELGQAYSVLGTAVSVVEMQASLLPGVEPRLVQPLAQRIERQFEQVHLGTRVVEISQVGEGLRVTMKNGDGEQIEEVYDRVLVAVGRRPVTSGLGLEATGVTTTDAGFVRVDDQRRTEDPAVFAVGDVAGQPMLAHKATHEGRVAAEVIHAGRRVYDPRAIPAVIFTDPEIAWCGVTESEARRQGLNVKVGAFPWAASGRAATLDREEGLTTVVCDADDGRVLGMGIVGVDAGELIAEGVLAIEMGAVAEDIALSIHAHPSLSETVMEAAEAALGRATHFLSRM
jgi:dihydrolipoamide dehydrogenase